MNFFYKQTRSCYYLLLVLCILCAAPTVSADNNTSLNISNITNEYTSNKPITIAVNKTSFPYHSIDKAGNVVGLMPDLWRLWAKKQNTDVKFVAMSWLDTLKQVSAGDVDIHAGLSIVGSRKSSLLFSKPLFSIYTHFYVNQTLYNVDSITALKPYTVGVIKGSAHIESLKANHPELMLKVFDNRHDLYQAALKNEILVFVGLEKLSDDFEGYETLRQRFPVRKKILNQQSQYGVAVAKSKNNLLAYIESGFEKISKEERTVIERKWLALGKQKDSLLITFPPNYPPYVGMSLSGKPQGVMIDVWRLWSEHVGIPVEFVAQDFSDGLARVAEQNVDISTFSPVNFTIPENTVFANSFYESNGVIFINENIKDESGKRLFSLTELYKLPEQHTFGLWVNSPLKEALTTQHPKLNLRYFKSINLMIEAAERGEVSGMIGSIDLLQARLVEVNTQTLFYRLEEPQIIIKFAPIIQQDNIKLLQIINQGFKELDLNKLVKIENKWLKGTPGDYYYKKQASKAALNEAEITFINSHKVVNLGVVKNLHPVEFINDKQRFSGINADFIKIISERTGINFNITIFDTWNDAYNAMLANQIDILGNVTETTERKKHMLFTDSYWEMPWGVIHPHAQGRKLQLSEFYGKKIAVVKGIYLLDKLRENHRKIDFIVVENRKEAANLLQEEKVDGFLISIASAAHILRQEENFNLMVSIMEDISSEVSHFAISLELPQLNEIFNKALLTVTAKEKQTIYDEWLTFEIKKGLDSSVVWGVALKAGSVVLIILFVILLWNRRLKVEIKYREALEKKMKHMATHDELTGLANRVLLQDRLDTAITFHSRQSLKLAVLFIDLDGFKNVNDTHGHDVGDELLQQVASRFQGCVRSSDTVARFGGDEFVVLLTGLHSSDQASTVAEKLLKVVQREFNLSQANASIGCSIGIAMYPDDADNAIDLIKVSDTLMYKVKASGKNHYLFN